MSSFCMTLARTHSTKETRKTHFERGNVPLCLFDIGRAGWEEQVKDVNPDLPYLKIQRRRSVTFNSSHIDIKGC